MVSTLSIINTGQSSIVRGNVGFVVGNYISTGGAAGVINAGGSAILAAGLVNDGSGAATSAVPVMDYNTASGMVTITPDNTTDQGKWWAIVQINTT